MACMLTGIFQIGSARIRSERQRSSHVIKVARHHSVTTPIPLSECSPSDDGYLDVPSAYAEEIVPRIVRLPATAADATTVPFRQPLPRPDCHVVIQGTGKSSGTRPSASHRRRSSFRSFCKPTGPGLPVARRCHADHPGVARKWFRGGSRDFPPVLRALW
jgi:hypothetical protein